MKCRYSYCKHGGEVSKEDAIKEGGSYFHKDCHKEKQLKQQIEEYYLSNMPPCTLQILRKVIKQLIHEKNMEAEYVFLVYVLIYLLVAVKEFGHLLLVLFLNFPLLIIAMKEELKVSTTK